MLTTDTKTYIAVGTSTTILLADADPKDKTSTDRLAGLEFTRASDGNFVLHGTTLVPGQAITVGSGSLTTTLKITTVQHTPAVVVDGTLTRKLGHNEPSRVGVPSASLPAVTTPPSPPANTHATADQATSSATSAAANYGKVQNVRIFALVPVLLGVLFAA